MMDTIHISVGPETSKLPHQLSIFVGAHVSWDSVQTCFADFLDAWPFSDGGCMLSLPALCPRVLFKKICIH